MIERPSSSTAVLPFGACHSSLVMTGLAAEACSPAVSLADGTGDHVSRYPTFSGGLPAYQS